MDPTNDHEALRNRGGNLGELNKRLVANAVRIPTEWSGSKYLDSWS